MVKSIGIILYKASLPTLLVLVIFLLVSYLTARPLLVWRCIGVPCLIIFIFLVIAVYFANNSWAGIVFYFPWIGAISLYGIVYLLSELIRFGILFFRSS